MQNTCGSKEDLILSCNVEFVFIVLKPLNLKDV